MSYWTRALSHHSFHIHSLFFIYYFYRYGYVDVSQDEKTHQPILQTQVKKENDNNNPLFTLDSIYSTNASGAEQMLANLAGLRIPNHAK